MFYKVKWMDYKEPTLEPKSALMRDVPELVTKYNNKHKL